LGVDKQGNDTMYPNESSDDFIVENCRQKLPKILSVHFFEI
jgi:hypothetical protein